MEQITGIYSLIILASLYMLPTIVAGMRSHHNQGPIFVINLLLGWTFLGWVIALAMAASSVRKELRA